MYVTCETVAQHQLYAASQSMSPIHVVHPREDYSNRIARLSLSQAPLIYNDAVDGHVPPLKKPTVHQPPAKIYIYIYYVVIYPFILRICLNKCK